jgi:hypothetical protein
MSTEPDEARCWGLTGRCVLKANHRGDHREGVIPMPEQTTKRQSGTPALEANRVARQTILDKYREEFLDVLKQERVKRGLPPVSQTGGPTKKELMKQINALRQQLINAGVMEDDD